MIASFIFPKLIQWLSFQFILNILNIYTHVKLYSRHKTFLVAILGIHYNIYNLYKSFPLERFAYLIKDAINEFYLLVLYHSILRNQRDFFPLFLYLFIFFLLHLPFIIALLVPLFSILHLFSLQLIIQMGHCLQC